MPMKKIMTIALDYDNTYTLDPTLWNTFVRSCQDLGPRVVIVTYRNKDLDPVKEVPRWYLGRIPVYYTAGVAKKWYMEHFGIPIDVWIDDKPETILENSQMSPKQLKEWRDNDQPK